MENNEIKFDKKQMSYIIAGLMLIGFFIFLVGFYCGKKSASNEFAKHIDVQTLTVDENIDENLDKTDLDEEQELNPVIMQNENEKFEIKSSQDKDQDSAEEIKENLIQEPKDKENIVNKPENNKYYYSEIAGFGSLAAANKSRENVFAAFDVEVIKRQSKTAKGKLRTWYQIITVPTDDMVKLKNELGQIKKVARIKNIKINQVSEKQKKELLDKIV